ncbi:DUF6545 domain-containing protein [Alloactinosynnema sp. L-07]|uniref:DUF6545 domain-containing protein n=1 Tax=Alloactinosynnema sp. L-07 TaxID=1653480 RepID=UPI0006B55E22|nr:DUF6545 domain-containing protein [Alloactinosynnema sp. L-07]
MAVLQRLVPNLSPALIRALMARNLYKDELEQAAEMFASTLMSRVARASMHMRAAPALQRAHTGRSLNAITPLWTALASILPEIVLSSDDYTSADDVDLLCRRAVEIRDAKLRLRAYVAPEVSEKINVLVNRVPQSRTDAQALRDAGELTAAIEAVRLGRPMAISASPINRRTDRDWTLAYNDLVEEARWSARVTGWMGHPFMTDIRRLVAGT